MKLVFGAKRRHRSFFFCSGGTHRRHRADLFIFTPACQYLPGFHIIPRMTPWEREGRWVVIDF